jgi:hypothetical protein
LSIVQSALDKIVDDINTLQGQSGLKRFWEHVKQPDMISDMKQELDVALTRFQVLSIPGIFYLFLMLL